MIKKIIITMSYDESSGHDSHFLEAYARILLMRFELKMSKEVTNNKSKIIHPSSAIQ